MAALMIDPVGNFLAGRSQARLTGVEQGEEGGDGLFSDMEHLRSDKPLRGSKKPAGCELSAVGALVRQLL